MSETPPSRIRRGQRARRIHRIDRRIVAIMAFAAIVGTIALVLALRPTAEIPYTSGPPLALPPGVSAPAATERGADSAVRLEAPAGGIDLGLVEGDGVHVPLNLAAHYPGTSEPGGNGNAVYYAHAQPGMFAGLFRLHLGDEVRVIRQDGTQLAFHVVGFKKVAFNDRSVLLPTAFGELTLLTCTSYDPYTPRFIVIAT